MKPGAFSGVWLSGACFAAPPNGLRPARWSLFTLRNHLIYDVPNHGICFRWSKLQLRCTMAFSNSSTGLLDASVSFGRRTSRRHQSDASADIEDEYYDFLALITAISELYSQGGVLEMQARTSKGLPLGRGGVAEVSTIYAAVTSPSVVVAHRVRRKEHVVVIKQSESKLFMPNGQHNNEMAIRAFISEIRILSHRRIRRHPNIVKILGIHWDYFQTVG